MEIPYFTEYSKKIKTGEIFTLEICAVYVLNENFMGSCVLSFGVTKVVNGVTILLS